MIVALAVLLNYAPAHALGSGGFLTTKEAQLVASLPPLDVHVIAALLALLPI